MPLQQNTTSQLGWDETYLHLVFECEDQDIWGNYLNHDDPIYEEEVVEAFLCPSGNLHRYYEFELSPNNVRFDGFVNNTGDSGKSAKIDIGWHCAGWLTAVRIESAGEKNSGFWIAQMAIPFAELLGAPHIPPQAGDSWRANFYRIERPRSQSAGIALEPEFSALSPTLASPADFHIPSRFAILKFSE